MDNRNNRDTKLPTIRYWTAFKYRDIEKRVESTVEANECILFLNHVHKHLLQFFMYTCNIAKICGIVT